MMLLLSFIIIAWFNDVLNIFMAMWVFQIKIAIELNVILAT